MAVLPPLRILVIGLGLAAVSLNSAPQIETVLAMFEGLLRYLNRMRAMMTWVRERVP